MNGYARLKITLLALAFMAISTQIVSGNGFTLEQILSSPFPADLIASKQGDKIAWVFDLQGKRNIWIAEAPAFKARQLTRYDKDDGQEITEPVFSPDGNWIAYTRGGPPNSDRDIPNPTSDPAGVKQEIWIASTRTAAMAKIGEGDGPAFSPRSDRVIFNSEDHLWSAPVPTVSPKTVEAKKMFEIRGEVNSPAWSPDGSLLAFVSSRGDHAFIALYDAKLARIRFLEPSVDRDIEPRWSPDGKRIAFIRLFNVADTFSADKERVQPWAIRVVDVSSGKGTEIWKSGETEMDSFSRLPVGDSILQWAADDRIVFASERDGWAHLYSVPAKGGEATALTPGNYEVENVAWSPDRSFVVVSSNAGNINHRHLWKVNIAGGAPEQLTEGDSIEMYPAIINGGKHIAFLHALERTFNVFHVNHLNF